MSPLPDFSKERSVVGGGANDRLNLLFVSGLFSKSIASEIDSERTKDDGLDDLRYLGVYVSGPL